MSVLFRIGIRNLVLHKAKTLIIGTIIMVGVVVLMVGSALMDTAALGIRRGFIDNYTGDIMISGISKNPISLFGVQSPGGIEDTPRLPNHNEIARHLESRDDVSALASQITGYAQLRYGELEGRSFTILFGIAPESYRSLFRNITFVDGGDLSDGEEGVVISQERVDDLVEAIVEENEKAVDRDPSVEPLIDFQISVGDEVRLTSFGNIGIKIRSVPITGIFEFTNPSEGLGIDLISYVDVQTARALGGLTIGYQGEFDLEEDQTSLLDVNDFEALFTEELEVSEQDVGEFDESALDTILGDTSVRNAALELDTGSWQFILAKSATRRTERTLTEINEWLTANGIDAMASNWEVAAGPFAQTADVIRQVFNIAIVIVGMVAVIIMVNTMVISVIERTGEIGTMRALGARKGMVWRLFLVETVAITSAFGLLGVAISFAIVAVMHAVGIPATNVFLRILFAGDALRPSISALAVFGPLLIATGVGLIAHLYPVSIALRIEPVRAMQSE